MSSMPVQLQALEAEAAEVRERAHRVVTAHQRRHLWLAGKVRQELAV
ncbi:MAG TPA: hypothetical protein VN493_02465 [Thermoanaerobaculia bacterium]|nr:hypothetical protein [Thermoanaerobaculia bacterium]